MTQSRRGSLIEAIINVLIGFGINFTANALLFPLFGWHISASQNLTLGLIYTGISIDGACKDDEPVMREDKGDFIWRGVSK